MSELSDDELLERTFGHYRRVCTAERALLKDLVELDRRELWKDTEAKCIAHWVSMHMGISYFKADRWVDAAYALEHLPLVCQAFDEGDLGIDQLVELTRLTSASQEPEASLLA